MLIEESYTSKNMKYCKKCIIPDTRPRITFDENGICSACQYAEQKKHIDWNSRGKEFDKLLDKYRSKNGGYDCIVPCSGGKDSATIAYKMKYEFGMHPLLVTVPPCVYTDIGRKNLDDLIAKGFDHIMYTPNPEISRKLARKLFIKFGDHFIPWVQAVFAIPLKIAVNFNIPLVIYAEDGEAEYGGTYKKRKYIDEITEEDIRKFYLTGNNPKDWIDDEITEKDLEPYFLPSSKDLKRVGVKPIHFGYFMKWNPYENYLFAKENTGFQPREGRSWGTYTNYASLDDQTDEFHYYLAWIKFGFCRATSDACHEIRDGQMTREEGVKLAKKHDGNFPKAYLKTFLEYLDITEKEFWEVVEKFRNKDIWEKVNGEWKLKTPLK